MLADPSMFPNPCTVCLAITSGVICWNLDPIRGGQAADGVVVLIEKAVRYGSGNKTIVQLGQHDGREEATQHSC